MRDDPDFNIEFVALIERHPCIYDYTSSNYMMKNIQDNAWETIAKEISETVEDCKDRWKNLRGCYTRYLKSSVGPTSSGGRPRKPYYLAEYLNFLQPFTKTRKSHKNVLIPQLVISSPENEQTETGHDAVAKSDDEADDAQAEDTRTEEERRAEDTKAERREVSRNLTSNRSEDNSFRMLALRKRRKYAKYPVPIAKVNRSALEYLQSRKVSNRETSTDDPDLAFFRSVLPDMRDMNSDQKRRFKVGILTLAGEILNECKPPVSPL